MDKKQHQQYISYDEQTGIGEIHDKPNGNPWARRQTKIGGMPTRVRMLALIVVAWLALLAIVLMMGWPAWVKIALLLGSAVAIMIMGPGLETPNYESEEWDVERD